MASSCAELVTVKRLSDLDRRRIRLAFERRFPSPLAEQSDRRGQTAND